MKRGTSRHPKLIALMGQLHLSRRDAIGLLELLWEFTADYAPAGDIGKVPDAGIAAAVEWLGNPGELVGSMVACGWLDQCQKHRLVIHHWKDHCPSYILKRVKRKELQFAVVSCLDLSGQREDLSGQREDLSAPPILSYPILSQPILSHSGSQSKPSDTTYQNDPKNEPKNDPRHGETRHIADVIGSMNLADAAKRNSDRAKALHGDGN